MPTVQCLFVGEFEQARDSIELAPLNIAKLACSTVRKLFNLNF